MRSPEKLDPRLRDRRPLTDDELRARFGIDAESRHLFADWRETLQVECGLPPGLLRPQDPIEILFERGRRSPIMKSFRGFTSMETENELNYRLQTQRVARGLSEVTGQIETVGELAKAWCEPGTSSTES